MIQYLPAAIMFLITVMVSALFVMPAKRWVPENGVIRFYWRGVWAFLVGITAISGGFNTLLLLDYPAVGGMQMAVNVLVPGFVAFVVLAWFHIVGIGALKALGRAFHRTTA